MAEVEETKSFERENSLKAISVTTLSLMEAQNYRQKITELAKSREQEKPEVSRQSPTTQYEENPTGILHTSDPTGLIHSSQKAEAAQMSIDKGRDKSQAVYTHNGI